MNLKDTINTDLKEAMIAKDVTKRDILRFIISQIKNKEIDSKEDLTNDEIIKIMQKEIKQIGETIQWLETAGDAYSVATEKEKIAVLDAYLPDMISEADLQTIVTKTIADLWIQEPKKNRGPIIWAIMKDHGASVDGKLLNEIINRV